MYFVGLMGVNLGFKANNHSSNLYLYIILAFLLFKRGGAQQRFKL